MARTTRLRRWLIAPLVCLVAGSLTTRSVPATASTGDWVNGNPVSALGPCGFGLVSRLDHFVSWYAKPGTEVSGALRYVKLTLENVGDCPIEPRQIRFFFGPHTRPAVDATNPTQCSVFNSATGQEGGALGCFVLDSMGGDEYGPIFLDAGKPIGLSLPVSFVLTLVIPVRTIWPDGGNEPFRVTVDDPGLSPVVTESSVPVPTVSGGVSIPPQPGGYTPVNPERLLETRPNGQTGYTGPRPGPGTTIEVQITGHAGIPTDATAAVLNITGTNAAGGYVTAYPCGTTRPNASNLNLDPGGTAPNLVITKIGTNGKVCLYTQNTTDLIADLNGWYPANSGYTPVNPERLLETRPNGQTGYTGPRPGPGTTIEVQITGHAGIPTDATAAVLNITGTNAAGGYITAYPCGTTRPNASNLNLDPGGTAPNLVITKIGTNGKVCLYTQNTTDLIADLNGWYPETNGVQP